MQSRVPIMTRYFSLVDKFSRSRHLDTAVQVNIFKLTVQPDTVMLLGELPYYLLTNEEVIKETGAWVHDSANSLLESRDLFIDIIASPEKIDDHACDESLASGFIESNYYSVKQCGRKFFDIKNKGLSILHSNIRSLKKT